jgi:alkylation response protein AidB-like acyl-CoA dehydrogenase
MAQYIAPIRDMQFVMHEMLNVEATLKTLPEHADTNRELIDQVLEEGGKFCSDVLFPINRSGDEEGCHFSVGADGHGVVTTPAGFKDAWTKFVAAGWPTLTADTQYGGQGLPSVVGMAFQEMMNSGNQAWTMYPGLTHGAYDCLKTHGTDQQKALYVPKLVTGEWLGTMCLTEPHCGTDLGMLRSKAEAQPDGSYKISGTKIFISAGEQDFTSNIVHLVLARMTDSPAGTKGISLFIVPKFLPDAQGNPGERNGIGAARIEEKMGIHGSPTCVMNLDNATGWLVGQPNKGLNAMFVMMNSARIGVGMQSQGLMEVAYQNSVTYAKERTQGRSLSGPKNPEKQADSIIVHPDVRRMLLTQRAYTEGSRMFSLWCAMQADIYHCHPDAAVRKEAEDMLALLTPVVKAFITDAGFECTNLAMQVLGGHGFIREWGMEQYVRDARINMIYEGTNTIQSLDLLGRKVLGDNGAKLRKFGAMVAQLIEDEGTNEAMAEFINPLADLASKVEKFTAEIGMKALQNPDEAGAAAVPYLRVIGHMVYGYFWAKMAKVALEKVGSGDKFYIAKLATARFYYAKLFPETATLMRVARTGAKPLMDLEEALF